MSLTIQELITEQTRVKQEFLELKKSAKEGKIEESELFTELKKTESY